jgi:putative transposase
VKHVFVKAAARLNKHAENSHQPTREANVASPKGTSFGACAAFAIPTEQKDLSRASARQHFALKRHLLRASLYRKQLAARFVAWREFTEVTRNPSTTF